MYLFKFCDMLEETNFQGDSPITHQLRKKMTCQDMDLHDLGYDQSLDFIPAWSCLYLCRFINHSVS